MKKQKIYSNKENQNTLFNSSKDEVLKLKHNNQSYIIFDDGHGKKHINHKALEKFLYQKTENEIKKKWGNDRPATFCKEISEEYQKYLGMIAKRWIESDRKSDYMDLGSPVGYDGGEETNYIQIYGEEYSNGKIGIHIRPKKQSDLKNENPIKYSEEKKTVLKELN